MNNPGYYIWKEDKEPIDEPELKGSVAAPPVVADKEIRTRQSEESQSEKLEILKRLRILEKHQHDCNLFAYFGYIDVFLVSGLIYFGISPLFIVPTALALIFTIYYWRRSQKMPITLPELEYMKNQCREGVLFCEEEDMELIEKTLHRARIRKKESIARGK